MLDLSGVDAFYDKAQALTDISLHIDEGEIVSLMGRNGAGKSTLLKTIMGLLPVAKGRKLFRDEDITALPPHKISRLGIAYVPEDRQTFPNLSVIENMQIAQIAALKGKKAWSMDDMFQLFPSLQSRRNNRAINLSGGEQQMLAISRALMSRPDLLLVDELSLGLMPKVIDVCYQAIADLNKEGLTIILVEQSTHRALDVADQVCVLESGKAVWKGTAKAAKNDVKMIDSLLGLREETDL